MNKKGPLGVQYYWQDLKNLNLTIINQSLHRWWWRIHFLPCSSYDIAENLVGKLNITIAITIIAISDLRITFLYPHNRYQLLNPLKSIIWKIIKIIKKMFSTNNVLWGAKTTVYDFFMDMILIKYGDKYVKLTI